MGSSGSRVYHISLICLLAKKKGGAKVTPPVFFPQPIKNLWTKKFLRQPKKSSELKSKIGTRFQKQKI